MISLKPVMRQLMNHRGNESGDSVKITIMKINDSKDKIFSMANFLMSLLDD